VSPVGLRPPSVTPRARNCKGPTLAAVHLDFAESCSNDRDQLSRPDLAFLVDRTQPLICVHFPRATLQRIYRSLPKLARVSPESAVSLEKPAVIRRMSRLDSVESQFWQETMIKVTALYGHPANPVAFEKYIMPRRTCRSLRRCLVSSAMRKQRSSALGAATSLPTIGYSRPGSNAKRREMPPWPEPKEKQWSPIWPISQQADVQGLLAKNASGRLSSNLNHTGAREPSGPNDATVLDTQPSSPMRRR
jgi:hypothetical protein